MYLAPPLYPREPSWTLDPAVPRGPSPQSHDENPSDALSSRGSRHRDSRRESRQSNEERVNRASRGQFYLAPPLYPRDPRPGGTPSKGAGKLGRTDDAGQSSVLASVHPVLDPSMEPLVRDSVGQTSLPAVELGTSIEEDGRVRPRSVNLLGDSRVIDSTEPEGSEIRREEGQCRPGDMSGRKEEIMVQSLRSSSAVRVQLYLNGMGIEATVATAADVTIVAEHFLKKLETPPATINKVVVYTAGKEQTLQASHEGPVTIKVGRHSSLETIYAAPIQYDMLLGLDYLKKYKATVDMDQEKLVHVHGEQFPLVSEQSNPPRISKVWLLHPTRIASYTAVNVQCRVDGEAKGDIMVESMGDKLTVMPTVLISRGGPPVVCLINLSDSELSAPSTSPIGEAQQVDILDSSILLRSGAGEEDGKMESGLLTPPVLSIPTADDPFILDTDASDGAVAAELVQVQGGVEKIIAYGSFALTAEQRRYCTARKELLAIIHFTRQFWTYLLGRPFRVRTDHASLVWLLNFKHPEGQLARWLEELGQYDMTILHRPGRLHQNADALSRMPVWAGGCENYQGHGDLAALPCGGCSYCSRAHKNWNSFLMEVDDVGQLGDQAQGVHMLPISGRVQQVSWAQALTPEEIRGVQQNDEELAIVVKWMERGGGGSPRRKCASFG